MPLAFAGPLRLAVSQRRPDPEPPSVSPVVLPEQAPIICSLQPRASPALFSSIPAGHAGRVGGPSGMVWNKRHAGPLDRGLRGLPPGLHVKGNRAVAFPTVSARRPPPPCCGSLPSRAAWVLWQRRLPGRGHVTCGVSNVQ